MRCWDCGCSARICSVGSPGCWRRVCRLWPRRPTRTCCRSLRTGPPEASRGAATSGSSASRRCCRSCWSEWPFCECGGLHSGGGPPQEVPRPIAAGVPSVFPRPAAGPVARLEPGVLARAAPCTSSRWAGGRCAVHHHRGGLQLRARSTRSQNFAAWVNGLQVAAGLRLSAGAATSLAEERVRGSLDVLMTTRLSTAEIVLGKWLGNYRFVPSWQ